MRTLPVRWLTWGTAAAAVSSALWLSSTNQGAILCSVGYRATSQAIGVDLELPMEPTHAGTPAEPSSDTSSPLPDTNGNSSI